MIIRLTDTEIDEEDLYTMIQSLAEGLCNQAGAELVGMGFIIEKAFQHGRDVIEAAGVRCESLAIVDSLDNCEIKLRED